MPCKWSRSASIDAQYQSTQGWAAVHLFRPPPCRAYDSASGLQSLNCVGPGAASTGPPLKASSGGFGAMLRAESDGDDEAGQQARRRHVSRGPG
eukprot:13544234-Alexandrium_andersonii.AAC.1